MSAGSPPSRGRAAAWAAGCSLLFVLVYGLTGTLAAGRADLGRLFLSRELRIPLVAWMIVPYWSIDLLFLGSFFRVRSRRELEAHGARIGLAVLVAGLVFLVMPLELGFSRVPVAGWAGPLFDLLFCFDGTSNLFPSLHVTLAVLLQEVYLRGVTGRRRLLVRGWFATIAASTVLVHQHHLVDVAGGWALARAVLLAIPAAGWRRSTASDRRLAARYLGGAAACALGAVAAGPRGALLLWPALSLLVVGCGYLGAGPGVYGKRGGRLAPFARLLHAPVLLAHACSLRAYAARSPAWDEITPRVWIGRRLDDAGAREALACGVHAVLDLAAELDEVATFREGIRYRSLPILDLSAPDPAELARAVAFVREAAAEGVVYVHCKAGFSRSALVVGASLLESGAAGSVEEAIAVMRLGRPSLVIRDEVVAALREFAGE